MKLIKNGSKVIGLLFADDTVKSYKVSGGYLSGLDLDANDDVDLSVGDYITSTLESNSQYDNFGDLRVTNVSDVEISDILKLMSLSKKDLIERIKILNEDIKGYQESGVDAEDFDRVISVFEFLRNIYSGLLNGKA